MMTKGCLAALPFFAYVFQPRYCHQLSYHVFLYTISAIKVCPFSIPHAIYDLDVLIVSSNPTCTWHVLLIVLHTKLVVLYFLHDIPNGPNYNADIVANSLYKRI